MNRLLYVGQQVADELRDNLLENIARYRAGDFRDMESQGDWRIPLSVTADLSELNALVGSTEPQVEVSNSLIVGRCLGGLTPTMARENRIWIRFSHVECLEYCRSRWLKPGSNDEDAAKVVGTHFFAPTLTACRDDHGISRLWWNYHIASQILPEDPERALKTILGRADIRLSLLERPGIAARPMLAKAIVFFIEGHEALQKQEQLFRLFMKQVNLRGAGLAFEALTLSDVDGLLLNCLNLAENSRT